MTRRRWGAGQGVQVRGAIHCIAPLRGFDGCFQLLYLGVYGRELLARGDDFVLFDANKGEVGSESVLDALDRAVEFFAELLGHETMQAQA